MKILIILLPIILQLFLLKANTTQIQNDNQQYTLSLINNKLNLISNPNSIIEISIWIGDCYYFIPNENYFIFVQQSANQIFKMWFKCSIDPMSFTNIFQVTGPENITISKDTACNCQDQNGTFQFLIQNNQQNQNNITLNFEQSIIHSEITGNTIYIFIFVSLAVLIIILCVSCYFCHCLDKRRNQILQMKKSLDKLLPLKLVSELFQQDKKFKQNDECQICLAHWDLNKSQVRVTPCQHIFHGDCIDKWYLKSKTCPCCRADLTIENIEKCLKELKESREKSQTQNTGQISTA